MDEFEDEAVSEPASDINGVSPTSLSHLIGQRGVIEQVKVAIDAAQMDGKKFDHALVRRSTGSRQDGDRQGRRLRDGERFP